MYEPDDRVLSELTDDELADLAKNFKPETHWTKALIYEYIKPHLYPPVRPEHILDGQVNYWIIVYEILTDALSISIEKDPLNAANHYREFVATLAYKKYVVGWETNNRMNSALGPYGWKYVTFKNGTEKCVYNHQFTDDWPPKDAIVAPYRPTLRPFKPASYDLGECGKEHSKIFRNCLTETYRERKI